MKRSDRGKYDNGKKHTPVMYLELNSSTNLHNQNTLQIL